MGSRLFDMYSHNCSGGSRLSLGLEHGFKRERGCDIRVQHKEHISVAASDLISEMMDTTGSSHALVFPQITELAHCTGSK
jgi:hypothetical protein